MDGFQSDPDAAGAARSGGCVSSSAQPAHRRRNLAVSASVFAAFVAFGWGIGSLRTRHEVPNLGLFVDPSSLDFGEAVADAHFPWKLNVENRSDSTIRITGWDIKRDCTGVEPRELAIPPGESQTIHLTLDLRPKGRAASYDTTDFEVRVLPTIADSLPAEGWILRGLVTVPLVAVPSTFDFGSFDASQVDWPEAAVVVGSRNALETLIVECPHEIWNRQTERMGGPFRPDGEFDLSDGRIQPAQFLVRLSPLFDLPEGPFESDVQLIGIDESGAAFPPVAVRLRGCVAPRVRTVPDELELGLQPASTPVTQDVELLLPDDLNVSSVMIESTDAIRLCAIREAGPGRFGLSLECRLDHPGGMHDLVIIVAVGVNGERHEVLLPVTGYSYWVNPKDHHALWNR
jgi:hypothetical protein